METNYKNVLLDFSFLDNLKGIDPRLASDGGKRERRLGSVWQMN